MLITVLLILLVWLLTILLVRYDLGSSESEAQNSLILDRQERNLYVASIKEAQKFLAQQWPKAEPIHMTHEEWTAMKTQILKTIKRNRNIDMEEIHRRMEEQIEARSAAYV